MNTKTLIVVLSGSFLLGCSSLSNAAPSSEQYGEWQMHTYPNIGLRMLLPRWKVDIDDQERRWSLFAYPIVENPAADVQYRVVVSIVKLTNEQHLRIYPKAGTNTFEWMNSQHMQTSCMTNDFWIYARKDVFGSNGFAYYCSGRIRRISNPKPETIQQVGGDEGKLIVDAQRILDSIQVLLTNKSVTH
jgi:hypothetical protein